MKFELFQDVYFLYRNKISRGVVIARKYSDRIGAGDYSIYTDGKDTTWISNLLGGGFTEVYIIYCISDKSLQGIQAKDLFEDKQGLLKSLDE